MNHINVLLVDDEEELIAAWVERLEMRGMNAAGATNGQEAIQLIKKNQYNVVVLDIRMPGIDGFELCSRLKSINGHRFFPVILLTALTDKTSKIKGITSGADDFISR